MANKVSIEEIEILEKRKAELEVSICDMEKQYFFIQKFIKDNEPKQQELEVRINNTNNYVATERSKIDEYVKQEKSKIDNIVKETNNELKEKTKEFDIFYKSKTEELNNKKIEIN
jgi:predicted  nucleic acid-binding Zn-ribbon protein